jgi:16S rRNA (cytidine1402-2'-O)-methyltransferase
MTRSSFPAGLYVAATPLGHLSDITERVREGLGQCDLLFAEDTRRAQQLLAALGIGRAKSTIFALHDHNEDEASHRVLAALAAGQSVMLISDAGTPAVSDPGFRVVDAAWKSGHKVVPLPGPSALTAAVSVSGFARWPISFWGFVPAKASARRDWLQQVHQHRGVAVIFEAPHRATESLIDCAAIFGANTPMLFAREMTKQHETLFRGAIHHVQQQIEAQQQADPGAAKGEMVWVFDLGDRPETAVDDEQLAAWAAALAPEMSAANAAKCLVKMLGVSRDKAYAAVLAAR